MSYTHTISDRVNLVPAVDSYASGNFRFWIMWRLALLLISTVFVFTMDIAPLLHKDEFTTLELGRTILYPNTDWSLTWLTARSQPAVIWFYIGPVLQELSFETLGQHGPRISSLLGALLAASAVVGWLMSTGASRTASFVLGIVFLLDPIFVQAYTMGRVDSWAFAFCILSCWTIRSINEDEPWKGKLSLAALLAVVGFFTWPSAVFIFPLILLELLLYIRLRRKGDHFSKIIQPILFFGLAGLAALVVIIIPIFPRVLESFSIIVQGLQINLHSGPGLVDKRLSPGPLSKFIELLRILKFSPVLPILAFFAVINRKQLGLTLAASVAIVILLFTVVYMHRVLYLLPYFVLAVAGLYTTGTDQSRQQLPKFLSNGFLVLLIFWASGLSIVARTFLTFHDQDEKKRELIGKAAMDLVGPGERHVFLYSPEFYYTGRKLGWKMYTPYTAVGEALSPEEMTNVLPKVDYFIMAKWELTPEFSSRLKAAGMHDMGTFHIYDKPLEKDDGITTNVRRLRNLYFIFRKPYGPYKVYVRHPSHSANAFKRILTIR
jgi:hypothetical protein